MIWAKLKGYGMAVLAFLLALFTANYYRQKTKRLERVVNQEKAKAHNLEAQHKAAIRHQESHQREIDEALKDDSHLNYFDDDDSDQP